MVKCVLCNKKIKLSRNNFTGTAVVDEVMGKM
jgi:hypothetical protein